MHMDRIGPQTLSIADRKVQTGFSVPFPWELKGLGKCYPHACKVRRKRASCTFVGKSSDHTQWQLKSNYIQAAGYDTPLSNAAFDLIETPRCHSPSFQAAEALPLMRPARVVLTETPPRTSPLRCKINDIAVLPTGCR